MIQVYIMNTDDGSKVYFNNSPNRKTYTKNFTFENMEVAYKYLVSNICMDDNKNELFIMNACIKLLVFNNNNLKEVILYDNYSDFCMHKKSKHDLIILK